MNHYTLSTGHNRESPRSEVAHETIKILQPMLHRGRHPIPGKPGYIAEVLTDERTLVCTVWSGRRPCVTFGVAPDEESSRTLWPILQEQYKSLLKSGISAGPNIVPPVCPDPPWVSVVIVSATIDDVRWLGDFERCLAWAWIEEIKVKRQRRRDR